MQWVQGPVILITDDTGHWSWYWRGWSNARLQETAIICVFESIKNVNKTQSVVLAAAACVWSASKISLQFPFYAGWAASIVSAVQRSPALYPTFNMISTIFTVFPLSCLLGKNRPEHPGSAGGRGRRRILYIIRNLDHHRNWFLGEQWFPGWERWDTAAGM